jgi:geranylgeranyl diphosphate synthase type II
MLRAACEGGAVLAGADEATRTALRTYGAALGAAFQITDDILDVTGEEKNLGKPVGSDAALGKNTFPSLVGLKDSRETALAHADKAVVALSAHRGEAADLLRGLAAYAVNRIS